MLLKDCRLIGGKKPILVSMTGIRQAVANNIKKNRKRLGLSQEELAEQSGIHRTYIGSVERCERNITIESLEKIAEALDIKPRDLLDE